MALGGPRGPGRGAEPGPFRAVDAKEVTLDPQCATRWCKLATTGTGIPGERLPNDAEVDGDVVVATSYGDNPANLIGTP